MKAAQIARYRKRIRISVNDIPVPAIGDNEILIRVKTAAVNPVDIRNLTGAVRLIQDYKMSSSFSVACGVFGKQHTILKRWPKVDRKS